MLVLLSMDEADCLAPNIDRDAMTEDSVVLAAGYRGSGLVHGPRRDPGNPNVAARKLTLPNQVATDGSDDD